MAIKTSNQITFTELKKITSINEYYTTTQTPELQGNEVWTTDIPSMTSVNKYLWNYEETVYSLGEPESTDPIIIGVYGESGSSLQVKYISSETTPIIVDNDVSAWSDEVPTPVDGEKVYMTQKMSTDIDWSAPIQISASDGKDGSASVEINNDGYWVINGEVTEVKAEGEDGKTPEITIGENGNWYIDGVDSGTKAQGEAGKDGSDIEYVYYRSEDEIELSPPSYTNDVLTSGWTASPQGITEVYKCEYVSVRNKPLDGDWGEFSDPVLWSRWGEKGQDGDGVEYKYYLSNSSTVPTYSVDDSKWTDDPTGVSIDNQYEYVVQIKTSNGTSTASNPSLWAKFGEDGQNGVGISEIVNYYQVTSDTVVPDTWQDSMNGLELSPTNKYLWNYEEIIYTEGEPTITDPAIIGVYGDSGTDAVDFQIYSVNGFEFSESLTSIELKTVAFQGGEEIENATYQWKWWNADSTLEDKYEDISGATLSTLTVNSTDSYALNSLRCDMIHDSITYSDYVTLTLKTELYTAAIKFFDGSNVFDPEKPYIAAYVEVYKNNQLDETKWASEYYDGANTVLEDSTIETDISSNYPDREFEENEKMYFIHKNSNNEYVAIIGQYSGGSWTVYTPENKYTYFNEDEISNVIVISRQDVTRSTEINIEVYQGDVFISRTSATIIDTNDPIVSDTAPIGVKDGQLWLDTSVNPYTLRIYTKKMTYALSEAEEVYITSLGSEAGVFRFAYSDSITVSDDGNISLVDSTGISIGYSVYTNAEDLKGKFYTANDGSDTTIYYMLDDAEITQEVVNTSYCVKATLVQRVYVTKSEDGEWEYFSQQNGGTVYTSIPLDGYLEGDLWIISDADVSDYAAIYPDLLAPDSGKFGAGTMLKAIESSSSFVESHWIDAQEDVNTVIKNIKESFKWDETGIKVMKQVTDSDGNITNPFYVHIDSTRMGFHSVEYENGEVKNDAEVVHVGVNSAVIKNANFVDDSADPDEYSQYEGTNGALFDCSVTFNQEINMLQSDTATGFVLKIEENGSLSLMIVS